MLECLQKGNQFQMHKYAMMSCQYEKATVEKTIPGIFRVIHIVGIQEDWLLIPGHLNLTVCKLGANTRKHVTQIEQHGWQRIIYLC